MYDLYLYLNYYKNICVKNIFDKILSFNNGVFL